MNRRWQLDLGILVFLFLIPLALFAPVTLGGRTILPADNLYQYEPWATEREALGVPEVPHNVLLSDLILQNYQWKWFINENLREGEIPLWQPHQFAGTPFLANGQHSMLYPFSVLYYVMPLSAAFGWFTVSQLWLAGLWMYTFIRGIGLGRAPGLVAALTVQLSSFFVVALVHPMIQAGAAWLPLLLLMLEYTIQRKPFPLGGAKPATMPWVLIGAVALGMVHLAGHLEILYYTLLVMTFYAAARLLFEWWQSANVGVVFQRGLALLLLVGLGFGVGAVQFIPAVEAANNSFRTERETTTFERVRSFALPERHLAAFLIPDIFGNPSHHSYYDVFEGETVQIRDEHLTQTDANPDFVKEDTAFGIKNYVEGGVYMGILPLVLAAIGLFGGLSQWWASKQINAPPYRLIFGTLAVITLLFMFGTPFYAILYYGLPGVNQLHTPFRWIWPFSICIAVFAAFGTHYLVKNRFPHAIARLGMSMLLGGVGMLAALAVTILQFESFRGIIERAYTAFNAADVFVDVAGFYSYTVRNLALFALMVMLAGVVLLLRRRQFAVGRGNYKAPLWLVAGVALIILDLFVVHWPFYPRAEAEWLHAEPPSAVWLQERMATEGPFRIQALDFGESPFHANAGWQFGLHDVRGYDSLFSVDYAAMMQRVAPQGGLDANRIDPITWQNPQAIDSHVLDLLNVRYLVTDWIIPPEFDPDGLGYIEVYADSGLRIYENTEALPRAYTVIQPTEGMTYQRNAGCAPDDAPTIALEDERHLSLFPPPTGTCITATPAIITNYSDIEVRVDARVDEPSWLVLADNYDDGWRAYVRPQGAGEDAEDEINLTQVNDNLRGVQLEPGEWTVRFRYSPPTFQIGAFLSFISGMVVIFLAVIWLWNTFVGTNADDDEGKRVIKNSVAPIALNLFNRGIDFAFAFIMLRILGPADAGIYYYAIVIFGWFDIVTNFGLNTLLTREVSRHPEAAGRYLYNTSILRLGLAVLGVPLLLLVLFLRNTTVEPGLDDTAIVAIVLLYAGLIPNSISTGLTALFYAFEKAEYPAAMTTVSTLVKVSLGLAALLLGGGVVGLAGASIATNFVTFLLLSRLAWPLVRNNWHPSPDGQFQRTMLREAWPLMINHLLATVFFRSDIVLMEAINGVAVVGVYSTAYKWLDALNIIPAFFTMALLPMMSRQAQEDRAGLRRNHIFGLKLLLLAALPIATVTTFLAYALVGLLGGAAFLPDGAIALQLMIWSIPIGWMNSLTQYVLIALDRQRRITGAFIAAVGFNVGANLLLLPQFSFRAAAVTTIISEAVLFGLFLWLLRDVLSGVNWMTLIMRPVLATGVMVAVIGLLWGQLPAASLLAGVAAYVLALGVLRPFDRDELSRLIRLLPTSLRRFVPQQVLLGDNL
jgi:O-antigen/teichoic acid export membrane protein